MKDKTDPTMTRYDHSGSKPAHSSHNLNLLATLSYTMNATPISWLKKKGGLMLALIGYAYYSLLMVPFTVFMTAILLAFVLIMVPLLVVGALHKDVRLLYRRFKAVGWGLLVMAFILFPTAWNVPRQIHVRTHKRELLIDPDAPEIEALSSEFLEKHEGLEGMTLEEIASAVRLFVLEKIAWELDYIIYGMSAHQATPSEVVRRGTDDCQGQAVVMASMLLHMGFKHVWLVEAPFHWWVIVRDNSLGPLPDGWEKNVDHYYDQDEIEFLNRGGRRDVPRWMWADPVLIFNQEEMLYPDDPFGLLVRSYSTGAYWRKTLTPLFFSAQVIYLLAGLSVLAFFVTAWTSYQSSGKESSGISKINIDGKKLFWRWMVLTAVLLGIITAWTLITQFRSIMDLSFVVALIGFGSIVTLASEPKFWSFLRISSAGKQGALS